VRTCRTRPPDDGHALDGDQPVAAAWMHRQAPADHLGSGIEQTAPCALQRVHGRYADDDDQIGCGCGAEEGAIGGGVVLRILDRHHHAAEPVHALPQRSFELCRAAGSIRWRTTALTRSGRKRRTVTVEPRGADVAISSAASRVLPGMPKAVILTPARVLSPRPEHRRQW